MDAAWSRRGCCRGCISIVVLLAAVNDPARGSRFDQVATRWDGAFYLDIARNGYGPVDIPFPKWPFFPLLPGLIRALERGRRRQSRRSSCVNQARCSWWRWPGCTGSRRARAGRGWRCPRGVVARAVPGVVRVLDDVPVGDLPRRVGVGVRARRGRTTTSPPDWWRSARRWCDRTGSCWRWRW